MEQIPNFGDRRQIGACVQCGVRRVESRDHVPSRVLLDAPYPENLPVVPTCRRCNEGVSNDEAYLACLVECARTGAAQEADLERPKVRRLLRDRPTLADGLARARRVVGKNVVFVPETSRVKRALLKLARGHAVFELNEPMHEDPALAFAPLASLPHEDRVRFEQPPRAEVWPEVGSRAMQRLAVSDGAAEWIVVQTGRYRYFASAGEAVVVRFVLSEYLLCEAIWDRSESLHGSAAP